MSGETLEARERRRHEAAYARMLPKQKMQLLARSEQHQHGNRPLGQKLDSASRNGLDVCDSRRMP